MSETVKQPLAEQLERWYDRHGRDLPWRHTRDPYRVWLSEVILQQTRVEQGRDYYLRFVDRFADVAALAAAPEDEVLKLWQGLGYYSRARNLHAAAREVVGRFGGRFPTCYDDLRTLPGIGEYTATAISSIVADEPRAVVDGNVYRVLARLYDVDIAIDTTAGHRAFAQLAREVMDEAHAGRYNQAIMDFGALQCTPAAPRCDDCPLSGACLALAAGTVAARPVKQGRGRMRDRWFNYLHLTCGEEMLLRRRDGRDIWQGLYELPMIETAQEMPFERLVEQPAFGAWVGASWTLRHAERLPQHQLTHQRLHATVYRLVVPAWTPAAAPCAISAASLDDYAVPRLLERYFSNR